MTKCYLTITSLGDVIFIIPSTGGSSNTIFNNIVGITKEICYSSSLYCRTGGTCISLAVAQRKHPYRPCELDTSP